MSEWTLTPTRLEAGVWEGLLAGGSGAPPTLTVMHAGRQLPAPEMHESDGACLVRLHLPAEVISGGVQTVVITDAVNDTTLATITLIAGEMLAHDIRAEVDLLRAELDLLKRAFRRHVVESD